MNLSVTQAVVKQQDQINTATPLPCLNTPSDRISAIREELLKINPQDAAELGLSDSEMVQISSRRGQTQAKTKLTSICPPGLVSMTFHFAESPTNVLTSAALDPVAKIPETKVCAVRVEKISA